MAYQQLGKPLNRIDAREMVTGQTLFTADRQDDNFLHLKIVFAQRPHARVKQIHTRQAEALSGVHCVLTAKDVPVNQRGGDVLDQPVLCGPGSAKKGGDIVRFVGDQVAVIVADTAKIATDAARLVRVDYEDLPVVSDPKLALLSNAPQLHPNVPHNLADYQRIRKGEPQSIWDKCNVIIEGVYRTPMQEHAFLEPEAAIGAIDEEGVITIHTAGQWAMRDQRQIAEVLELPEENVQVVYNAVGGAFGGRQELSVQIALAVAVLRMYQRHGNRRPIKVVLSRSESFLCHCKRHPMLLKTKWGAQSDGTLLVAETEVISDAGAYMYSSQKILHNALLTCTGPYYFPHVKTDGFAVYTNNHISGSFRGGGTPQAHYAAEMQMNKLAEKLGIDPIELRLKNILDDDKELAVGTVIPGGVSLDGVIREVSWRSNWRSRFGSRGENDPDFPEDLPRLVSGRGIAVGFKNFGLGFGQEEQSWAEIELDGTETDIEKVIIRIAGAELGQGHYTVMAQLVAESLEVSPDIVQFDTTAPHIENPGGAQASRLTFMAGNAVLEAASFALRKWGRGDRPAHAEATWLGGRTSQLDPTTGYSVPYLGYGYVAQIVELTVDTETGEITVNRVVCADDVGRALNPDLIIGQMEGAIVQAHGYALMENFALDEGRILTPSFETYLIPTVADIPNRIDPILVENPHPNGPHGARGMAELPIIPYAAAVSAAVFDAIGIWFDSFPLTPERILRGIGKVRSRL